MPESPFFRPGRGKPSRNSPCPQIPDPDSHVLLMICPYFLLFSAPSFSSHNRQDPHRSHVCSSVSLRLFSQFLQPSCSAFHAFPRIRSSCNLRLQTCCQFLFTEIQEPIVRHQHGRPRFHFSRHAGFLHRPPLCPAESLKTSTDPHSPVTEKQYSAPHA